MARAGVARVALAALGALALAAGVGAPGRSSAAFTDQTANPSNEFSTAATFCPSPSTQTVTAARDAYVDQAAPNGNYGTRTNLDVQSRKGANARTLVGFGLPALPGGCSTTAAVLKLTASSAATGRTLQALRVDPAASWTEGGVTWATQPPTTGSAVTAPSALGLISWDVTAAVQAMYAEARAAGSFQVRDATEDSAARMLQRFGSREAAADRPVLEVTFG